MSPTFRFIPAMYRAAVVDRVKTQTRRVITPPPREGWELRPGPCYHYAPAIEDKSGMLDAGPEVYGIASEEEGWIATYGPPGTILPVVTTWAIHRTLDMSKPSKITEVPDQGLLPGIWWDDGVTPKPDWAGKSRPAMFFPKHLYSLARQAKVVSVKAEPVQDISAADAIAEGVRAVQFPGRHPDGGDWLGFHNYQFETAHPKSGIVLTDDQHRITAFASPIESYRTLWDSINAERGKGEFKGQYAWKRNPWVFATTFEVLA